MSSLFPECSFELLVAGGKLRVGEHNDCQLVLRAVEAIPRARSISLVFSNDAWMGFGSGKQRRVTNYALHRADFQLRLPESGLEVGETRHPVRLWVPPTQLIAYDGEDCGVRVQAKVNLDVDWALDPHITFEPPIEVLPVSREARPISFRTDRQFHEKFVVELTLESDVVAQGNKLVGAIALRGGTAERFDSLTLGLASCMTLGSHGSTAVHRLQIPSVIQIAAEKLRGGAALPFAFPISTRNPPSMGGAKVALGNMLTVTMHVPWHVDPQFQIPITVTAAGSSVVRSRAAPAIGAGRIAQLARALAADFGTPADKFDPSSTELLHVQRGLVTASLRDETEGAQLGIRHRIDFPELGLGMRASPWGLLSGFRSSKLLPAELGARYQVDFTEIHAGSAEFVAAEAFVTRLTANLGAATIFELSDHHVSWFYPYSGEELAFARSAGQALALHAEQADALIGTLLPPSGIAHALLAYRRLAELVGACARPAEPRAPIFVPSLPALLGIRKFVRVAGGEVREFVAHIQTVWPAAGLLRDRVAHTQLMLTSEGFAMQVPESKLRKPAPGSLPHALPPQVADLFPTMDWAAPNQLVLGAKAFVEDPAPLLGLIDVLVDWAIAERGERRVDAPYR